MTFLIHNLSVAPGSGNEALFAMAKKRMKGLSALPADAAFSIYRKSIDARKKEDVRLVYTVAVSGSFTKSECERLRRGGIAPLLEEKPTVLRGNEKLSGRPIVVGAGPAGLFAALLLAEAGYAPLLIERGGSVTERAEAHLRFTQTRKLDTECNIQFGAGGAGTFSDGKLVTRVNDPLSAYVLSRFAEFGAPSSILTEAKPHIGTDYLCRMVDSMLERIQAAGGEVLFHTRLLRPLIKGGKVYAALTDKGEIPCGALLLAIGHSARDTYENLIEDGLFLEPKPFSVGVRIEHLQEKIDAALYGRFAGHPDLKHASYNFSADTDTRGVYTFCMCPGGTVVAAASEEGGVVVNGMSEYARSGKNANAALAVSVFREDYGNTPRAAIAFQRKLERDAFLAGGGDYSAPFSTVGDFLADKAGSRPTEVLPTYMDGGVTSVCLSSLLPPFVSASLKRGITAFGRRLAGFDDPAAILTGVETRTSSPIRILRNEARVSPSADNLYPVGEGAGYAGGITSAALDGLKSALSFTARFAPFLG